MSSSYASKLSSYKSHCVSLIPESISHKLNPSSFPLGQLHTGYFIGGDRIFGNHSSWHQNSFSLKTKTIYATNAPDLFRIEATLSFRRSHVFYYGGRVSSFGSYYGSQRNQGKVVIKLDGYWSESSGKLCMNGKGSGYSQEGDFLHFNVAFMLSDVVNTSEVTSLIRGSLESLNSANDRESYFEPISVLMLPKKNYKYSLDSAEVESEFSSDEIDSKDGLSMDSSSFCSDHVSWAIGMLNLEYSKDCNSSNCNPISGVNGSSLPNVMSLNEIECSSHVKKPHFRVLVGFPNDYYYYRSYSVASVASVSEKTPVFVGEGWWDEKKNQLCVVGCHFMGVTTSSSSLDGAHVGDCSIRLRLRFPSVLSIQDTSPVVGQIWSNKTVKDSSYFDAIKVRNNDNSRSSKFVLPGLKYEYTKLEKAKEFCPRRRNHVKSQEEKRYPDISSYYMRSDMSIKDSNTRIGWGYATPLTVGDEFYGEDYENLSNGTFFNVSYEITINLYSTSISKEINSLSNKSSELVRISAEGTYDAETGNLCMIGCRNLVSSNSGNQKSDSKDCEISIKFEFPPLDASRRSYIKGSIESTRKTSDPLYFKFLNLSSSAYYTQGEDTAWRMDMEIIMFLVSTTLACVFVVYQLFYVKRHPNVVPFISLTMLSILTLGHMVPLVLNFEALFTQNPDKKNFLLGHVGWFRLEVNETTARLFTMVAFLLQFRLLQLTWSSRKGDEKGQKTIWVAEKKALYITLPLYALGFLIALLIKLKNNNEGKVFMSSLLSFLTSKSFAFKVHASQLLQKLNIPSNSRRNF